MSDFRQNFLAESINKLKILQAQLAEDFAEDSRREVFRTIHTVKGGAQTFGLSAAAKIADNHESILANGAPQSDENLLLEGIAHLMKLLGENENETPDDFIEKLQTAVRTKTGTDILLTNIPQPVFEKFSMPERAATLSALREGKNIYCVEVGFEAADFADRYRNLRKVLAGKSEIIASLPSEKHASTGKIGFRIFLASREPAENLQILVKDFDAEVSSHACRERASDDLFEMLSHVAAHAADTAEKSGKEVHVSILANDAPLSADVTKALFDILLHLVRNAVDHAVEQSGKVEIRLFEMIDGLHLSVADDGRGIDLSAVRRRAVAKNLISDDDLLSDEETRELILAPELSTAAQVTEISGRGIGLDAVKTAVEKLNGKISVKSRNTNGTIFEIFLPREKI